MKNKKILIISVLAILSLVLITIGATVAFFSYIGQGSTENTIESGSINFIYEEVNKMGNGISITDALPVSDSEGKASNNYFDFKVKSSTGTTIAIPYEITARVSEGSDDLSDYVKLYLTKVNGTNEQQVALSIYSNLSDSTNTLASTYNDKTLYKGEIPVGSTDYTENYRLRMWLNDNPTDGSVLDYSPVYACTDTQYTTKADCESNNGVWNPTENYNNQNKTFSIKVNVYANGEQASQQKIESATTTDIAGLKINNTLATESTNSTDNYDYYVETSIEDSNNIEIIPLNDGQTYTVENITEQEANTIKGVSTNQNIILVKGINYLKVTVTSANKQNTKDYVVKANILANNDATLQSLNIKNCNLNETFNTNVLSYTCSTNEANLIINAIPTYSGSTVIVNGNNELENGENTITVLVTADDGIATMTYTIIVSANVPETGSYLSNIDNITLSGLAKMIYDNNEIVTTELTNQQLKTMDNNDNSNKLFVSTETNSGKPTYFFRGKVDNNYVSFAGETWRIVRINEDGTVRLILENGINNNANYIFQPFSNDKKYMYYTTYDEGKITAKTTLDDWYTSNIINNNLGDKVANGKYFCEQAKVSYDSTWASGSGVNMNIYNASDFVPDFRCENKDGHGLVKSSIALITYEEMIYSGTSYVTYNSNYYMYKNYHWWTMSPAGVSGGVAYTWFNDRGGTWWNGNSGTYKALRPVINLKANVTATGTGTSLDPYTIVYN